MLLTAVAALMPPVSATCSRLPLRVLLHLHDAALPGRCCSPQVMDKELTGSLLALSPPRQAGSRRSRKDSSLCQVDAGPCLTSVLASIWSRAGMRRWAHGSWASRGETPKEAHHSVAIQVKTPPYV